MRRKAGRASGRTDPSLKSTKNRRFDKLFGKLPKEVQELARKQFRIWIERPAHPSLRFKLIDEEGGIWSVRVGDHYRAVCQREGDSCVWFWIGTHEEYNDFF